MVKPFLPFRNVILIFVFFLPACNHANEQKALTDLFNKVTYDTTIIHNLSLYDSLRKLLVQNLDTIFKFRDSRTLVFHGSGEDSGRTTHKQHDFYMFFFKWNSNDETSEDDISLKTFPAFIYPAVTHIFEALGRSRIGGITISTDSTIEIALPVGFINAKTKASVRHTLRWKMVLDISDEPLAKDTIIAPGWNYEILVTERPKLMLFNVLIP